MRRTSRRQLSVVSCQLSVTGGCGSERRGTVMVVVLALLGMLLLVGFMFYTFASQEQASGEYFRRAADEESIGIEADYLFDFVLKQVLVGPETGETNSALWGGRHAVLPSAYGRDIHPFSGGVNLFAPGVGAGANLIAYNEDLPQGMNPPNGVLDPGEDVNGNGLLDFFLLVQDQDNNGFPDDFDNNGVADTWLLDFNDSPAAFPTEDTNGNGRFDGNEQDINGNNRIDSLLFLALPTFPLAGYPSPDVTYTAPDLNSVFLAYRGTGLGPAGHSIPVVVPSYFRPQYMKVPEQTGPGTAASYVPRFEDANGNGVLDQGEDRNGNGVLDDWFYHPGLSRRSMRPHPLHRDIDDIGRVKGRRYVWSRDEVTRLRLAGHKITGPFPFAVDLPSETGFNGAPGEMGAWSVAPWRPDTRYKVGEWVVPRTPNGFFYRCVATTGPNAQSGSTAAEPSWQPPLTPPFSDGGLTWQGFNTLTANHEFDADPDGDGIREAIWLDLDFPVQERSDGQLYVPMFAITIYDAEGLLNLNAHGNIEGRINLMETRQNLAAFGYGYGPDGRPGVAGIDDDGSAGIDDPNEIGTAGSDDGIGMLSQSNLGLTPSEVNPQWPLNAVPPDPAYDPVANPTAFRGDMIAGESPADVFQQHELFFGRRPGQLPSSSAAEAAREASNMEWWFANAGKMQFQSSGTLNDLYAGRYGDTDWLVANGLSPMPTRFDLPRPARSGVDDAMPGTDDPPVWNPWNLAPNTQPHPYWFLFFSRTDPQGNVDAMYPTSWPFFNRTYGAGTPAFIHPLDFRGTGLRTLVMRPSLGGPPQVVPAHERGRLPDLFDDFLNNGNPNGWARYLNYSATRLTPPMPNQQPPAWHGLMGGSLMTVSIDDPSQPPYTSIDRRRVHDPLVDEAYEMEQDHEVVAERNRLAALAPALFSPDRDEIFEIGESAALQLSGTDLFNLGLRSRLLALLEFNFVRNVRANEIRRQFTTLSRDLKTFGVGQSGNRHAEEWRTGEFPPAIALLGMRRELHDLLKLHFSGSQALIQPSINQRRLQQRKFSVNHVLDWARDPQTGEILADPQTGQAYLEWRALTPHPVNPVASAIPTVVTNPQNPPPVSPAPPPDMPAYTPGAWTPAEREAWARRDRQMLARDIYTLLYYFCGGEDNPTEDTNGNGQLDPGEDLNTNGQLDSGYFRMSNMLDPTSGQRALYNNLELREMAQTAINLVSALDRDHVIDRFEYDKDLSNGWFQGDNDPYTRNDLGAGQPLQPTDTGYDREAPFDSAERGEVDGVEAQMLTLSEVMAVRAVRYEDPATMMPDDLDVTLHRDDEEQYYVFVEMRNASPFPVDLLGGQPVDMTQPMPAGPSTNGRGEHWALEVVRDHDQVANTPDLVLRRLVFTDRPPSRGLPGSDGLINAGRLFAVHSGSYENPDPEVAGTIAPTYFSVDVNYSGMGTANLSGGNNRIAPRYLNPNDHLDTVADLNAAQRHYRLEDGAQPPNDITSTSGSGQVRGLLDVEIASTTPAPLGLGLTEGQRGQLPTLKVRLLRRAHLGWDVPTNSSVGNPSYDDTNPWIVVDQTIITDSTTAGPMGADNEGGFSQFDMNGTSQQAGADAQQRLVDDLVKSIERSEPLSRNIEQHYPLTATPPPPPQPATLADFQMNTIGRNNELTAQRLAGQSLEKWQAHVDRDFATLADLFALPLYGPTVLTRDLAPGPATGQPVGWNTAGARKFLRPLASPSPNAPVYPAFGPDLAPGDSGMDDDFDGQIDEPDEAFPVMRNMAGNWVRASDDDGRFANRWVRLLEFVEVPTPVNAPTRVRTPGKINPNTIRDAPVLAGLIDDETAFAGLVPWTAGSIQTSYLPDAAGEGGRDWWLQFLLARDGQDPATGLVLPGTPWGRPFLGLSAIGRGPQSVEDTLLRSLPLDAGLPEVNRRRLFELSTAAQRGAFENPAPGSRAADTWLKHGVLSKVLNNTTPRSNVFFAFIQVDFFEVVRERDPNTGEIAERIGARLADSPGHRAFFVIDRTLGHETLNGHHFAGEDSNGNNMLDQGVLGIDDNGDGTVDEPQDEDQLDANGNGNGMLDADPAYFRYENFPWRLLVRDRQIIE